MLVWLNNVSTFFIFSPFILSFWYLLNMCIHCLCHLPPTLQWFRSISTQSFCFHCQNSIQ
jgi:hypothetical protein